MLLTSGSAGTVNVTIRSATPAQPVAISISVGRCVPDGGSVVSFLTAPASFTGTATGRATLTRLQVAALNEAISGRRPLSIIAFAPGDTGCGDLVAAPRVGTARLQGSLADVWSYDLRYLVISGIDATIAGRVNAVLRANARETEADVLESLPDAPDPEIEGLSTVVQTFSVSLSRPSLLSLMEHESRGLLFQPHGDERFHGFTFDLTTGGQIQLEDLFRPGSDYLEALGVAARKALVDRGARAIFADLVVSASGFGVWQPGPGRHSIHLRRRAMLRRGHPVGHGAVRRAPFRPRSQLADLGDPAALTEPVTPRVSLITLAVSDVARATEFYRALGWEPSSASLPGDVTFIATQGALLGLWGRDALAADAGVAMDGRNAALAINLESREAVDAAFARVAAAGGEIVRAPHATEWGGYSGYFADPDRNLWEIAHNPFWPIGADGRPQLP